MNYLFLNEERLIRDIKKGDSGAFRYVFDLYYSDLCRYVTRFTLDSAQAEDIVQNILLTLWRDRKKTEITTSLKSYLYKAGYNGYIDLYRKEKKISLQLETIRYVEIQRLQNEDEAASEALLEKKEKLKIAIDRLPEKCREVFLLHKYEGLQYKEIAEELDLSLKTVENHMGNALKRLKEALTDQKGVSEETLPSGRPKS